MSKPERQQSVLELLKNLRGLEPLKKLFWSELNYQRVNQSLSRRGWPDVATQALAEDPVLFAGGGQDEDFHVIYARLASGSLRLGDERPVVSRLLKDHPYALFAFSNSSQDRWHFLNVKYDEKAEKRRLFRRITVGAGERLRTASERLAMLDLEAVSPDLYGISPLAIQQCHDQAFDVEAVTKKFFEQYAQVFARVEGLIQGLSNQERKRLFTQRLFNRLMFIAFIQKKGWLKFNSDADYLPALWKAYQRDNSSEKSFYNQRLKILFFLGLNTPNEVDLVGINRGGFLQDLIGAVPYLNGGLFEEDDDDRNPDIVVPDESIAAIFNDLFDRFNFTVTESTPLDVEIAVDPEMLGKVFEELVTGRHETGSYYTPKPVVSFMGREALKGYLASKLPDESAVAIEKFVDEHDPAGLRDAEAVLDVLRRVKTCDPACGSGAHLLAMLHELMDLRQCLFVTRKLDPLSAYDRKLEIIQNSVYGVDLDPFAVNIARLRLWLSLAVDFEGDHPPPLPNLDFKIEAGDSLTAPDPSGGETPDMYRHTQIENYYGLKAKYLMAHGSEKLELRKQIETARKEIAEWAHEGHGIAGFDWQVEFAEVFEDGGFDIIVANPPYVRQELIKDLKPALKAVYPAVYTGTADLYCFFYARALQLLRSGGMLVFISSNKWFRAAYGANLRKHVAETCHVISITDFGDLPVFESATAYPMIFIAQKDGKTRRPTVFTEVSSLEVPYPDMLAIIREKGQALPLDALNGAVWNLTDEASAALMRKIQAAGVPLKDYVEGRFYRGILTGFNEAFVIDETTRKKLIKEDRKSAELIKPWLRGRDIKKWKAEWAGIYLLYIPWECPIDKYPSIKSHLLQFKGPLAKRPEVKEGRYPWYALGRYAAEYHAEFERLKIVYQEIATYQSFALADEGLYCNNKCFLIPGGDLYLLGLLNTKLSWWVLGHLTSALQGGAMAMQTPYLSQLTIARATPAQKAPIIKRVEAILKDPAGPKVPAFEAELDELGFDLYKLTEADRQMVLAQTRALHNTAIQSDDEGSD